jgi:hypothetical protein
MMRCKDVTDSDVFPSFFYFSVFFLKKNSKTPVGVVFFSLVSGPTNNTTHKFFLKKKKLKDALHKRASGTVTFT